MTLPVWRLDRLSVEHIPVNVADGGTPVTGWTYAVLRRPERPANTAAISRVPTDLGGQLGILVGPGTDNELATPGTWQVFVRYADSPEAPVIIAGYIVIT